MGITHDPRDSYPSWIIGSNCKTRMSLKSDGIGYPDKMFLDAEAMELYIRLDVCVIPPMMQE